MAGAYFTSAAPINARGNGCPNIRSFDLLAANASVPSSRGQLAYQKSDGVRNFASIANYNVIDVDYKTVVDGVAVGVLRDPHGNIHNAAFCDVTTPAITRSTNVIQWFQLPGAASICRIPMSGLAVPPGPGAPPPLQTRLGAIAPNPLRGSSRVAFSTRRAGERIALQVFDVTGRLVRVLHDGPVPEAGAHEVAWDGQDDRGERVVSGLYFVRLATRDVVQSKKVVVAR